MNSTIRTNMDSVRNYNIFNQNQVAASKSMTRATTGLRIASVADGPADWAVSKKMQERINSLNQASQNIQSDNALANTAADGIAKTVDVLTTLKARILHAANGASSDNDATVLAKEITNLLTQIDDNAKDVKYNGKALLDGTESASGGSGTASASTFSFRVGEESSMTITLKVAKMTATGLSLSASNFTTAALKTTSGSTTAIKAIDTALGIALGAATDVGSIQQRLGYTADNVASQIENLEAANSAVVDSNFAKEISDYMKWNVLTQASQYMLAQSNQNAFSVLNLLQ